LKHFLSGSVTQLWLEVASFTHQVYSNGTLIR